jgi:hypothetical protein
MEPPFSSKKAQTSSTKRCHAGEDVIIAGSVSDEEAKQQYPQGWKAPRPYIRIVAQPH